MTRENDHEKLFDTVCININRQWIEKMTLTRRHIITEKKENNAKKSTRNFKENCINLQFIEEKKKFGQDSFAFITSVVCILSPRVDILMMDGKKMVVVVARPVTHFRIQ